MKLSARSMGVGISCVLLASLLAFGAWWLSNSNSNPAFTVPSGAVVTLRKVTYGKEHRFVCGKLWQRMVSWLPQKWLGRWGGQVVTHSSTNDTLVAWLVWTGKPDQLMRYVPGYVVEDDQGRRVQVQGASILSRPNDSTLIDGRELVWPRRAKSLHLRLFQLDTNSQPICVANFKLPTPPRKTYPVWQPGPLPVRRVDGNVEFTLTRLAAEKEIWTSRGFSTPYNRLAFRIAENGQPTTNWQLVRITASDAVGNRNIYNVASYPDREGQEVWTGSSLLWPDESAWRLNLAFARRGDFAADELWIIRDIPVPGREGYSPQSFQTNLQGSMFLVRGITDAQSRLPDGSMSVNAEPSVLDIKWSPAPEGLRVTLLGVTDDRGKKVEITGWAGGRGSLGYGLKIPAEAKTVDATVAVRRNCLVEYVAKPELVSTNEAR